MNPDKINTIQEAKLYLINFINKGQWTNEEFSLINPISTLLNAKTLRDEFACAALHGVLQTQMFISRDGEIRGNLTTIARSCYCMADAMLTEREKGAK